MKKYYLNLSFLLLSIILYGQDKGAYISDLSLQCPHGRFQFKTTCYAYAVVYTAMSTEYNIENKVVDTNIINKTYFSSGIVASYHNSSLPFYYRSPNCGRKGTADGALEILKSNGTTFNSQYDCDCKAYSRIRKELKSSDKFYRISGYERLEVKNKYSDSSISWIRNALNQKHPVIIGVYQNNRLQYIDTKEITDSIPDAETMSEVLRNQEDGVSNHAICILGYNDNYLNGKGYFLLKNNFEGWGNGLGFSWVPYTFILPLIHEAYFIKGIF